MRQGRSNLTRRLPRKLGDTSAELNSHTWLKPATELSQYGVHATAGQTYGRAVTIAPSTCNTTPLT
jgi:hypothetical protein